MKRKSKFDKTVGYLQKGRQILNEQASDNNGNGYRRGMPSDRLNVDNLTQQTDAVQSYQQPIPQQPIKNDKSPYWHYYNQFSTPERMPEGFIQNLTDNVGTQSVAQPAFNKPYTGYQDPVEKQQKVDLYNYQHNEAKKQELNQKGIEGLMSGLQVLNLVDPLAYASAAIGNPDKTENTFADNMLQGYYDPRLLAAGLFLPFGKQSLAVKTAKRAANMMRKAGNAAWHSTWAQYPRYYLGKLYFGKDAQLPTLYRKIGNFPAMENDKVRLTPVENRFAFADGTESPVITNVTTDVPVRAHGNNIFWNMYDVMAVPGRSLLGKHVISTRPSDTFIYGDILTVKPKRMTYISGNPERLAEARASGMKTMTSNTAQDLMTKARDVDAAPRASNLFFYNDYWDDYAKDLQGIVRSAFKSPTVKDYKFMDWVFQPEFKSNVIPYQDMVSFPIARYNELPDEIIDAKTNSAFRE